MNVGKQNNTVKCFAANDYDRYDCNVRMEREREREREREAVDNKKRNRERNTCEQVCISFFSLTQI